MKLQIYCFQNAETMYKEADIKNEIKLKENELYELRMEYRITVEQKSELKYGDIIILRSTEEEVMFLDFDWSHYNNFPYVRVCKKKMNGEFSKKYIVVGLNAIKRKR